MEIKPVSKREQMKKTSITFIVLLLIVGAALFYFFLNSSEKRVEEINEAPKRLRNDLPNIPITTLEGTQTSTRSLNEGKTILVFFQPDCDHCQREAEEIVNHLEKFKEYKMYFISSGAIPAIQKFSKDYKLEGFSNIVFARTEGDNVLKTLGPIETPSLYIYKNGQIVKAFNGETPVTNILSYL